MLVDFWKDKIADPLKSIFSNAGTQISNSLSNIQVNPNNPLSGTTPGAYPAYAVPESYQVKTGDTFESIANQYGMDESDLQNINNQLVTPPKGSFITLNKRDPRLLQYQIRQAQANQPFASTGQTYKDPRLTRYEGDIQLTNTLTTQLTSGNLPNIPVSAAGNILNPQTGQPMTPQEWAAMGYVYNESTKQLENPNRPQQVQGVTQGVTPYGTTSSGQRLDARGQVFDPRNAAQATDIYGDRVVQQGAKKWVRGKDGKVRRAVAQNGRWVVQKPRGRQEEEVVQDPAFAVNTPTQQLSVLLGSG